VRCIKAVRAAVTELILARGARGIGGQELVEYALVVGFIAVSVAAVIPYQVVAPLRVIFNKVDDFLHSIGGA
jgi:Flp pilus assembly pilin Flp